MPVFEEYVRPKRAPDRVSDKVPWRAVIAPGVVLQKDRWQTLQRTYAVRGPDVMGLAREVQGSLIMRANNVLKKLGGKWMLHSEAQRVRVTDLPPLAADCPLVVRLLDADHRATETTGRVLHHQSGLGGNFRNLAARPSAGEHIVAVVDRTHERPQ